MSDSRPVPRPVPRPDPSAYSDRDDEYDEDPDYGNAPDGQMFTRTNLPSEAILSQIKSTKDLIATLLEKPNDSNLDFVIQQMTVNGIKYNPNEPNSQIRFDKLRELLKQLNEEKKGGKKHKSKRYRKSRKQRKTKTKRRLRRSYKYK